MKEFLTSLQSLRINYRINEILNKNNTNRPKLLNILNKCIIPIDNIYILILCNLIYTLIRYASYMHTELDDDLDNEPLIADQFG